LKVGCRLASSSLPSWQGQAAAEWKVGPVCCGEENLGMISIKSSRQGRYDPSPGPPWSPVDVNEGKCPPRYLVAGVQGVPAPGPDLLRRAAGPSGLFPCRVRAAAPVAERTQLRRSGRPVPVPAGAGQQPG